MKQLLILSIFLFTSMGFAQNTGLIVGKVLDKELNNEPLVFANIAIKGTSTEFNSDTTGLFVIENLEEGDYTLVCSFVGYETKEINVHVNATQPVELNIPLAASTVSLNDLAALGNIATNDDRTAVASK
ncbi:carboxypeptidase-like regulatory domain-containing protein [Yeosuana marina]|uniref:carboxypeptidase-like regulatory domain-containing protein n=1 Tax=Yeosuana marina TaxID=1565536 RepID=UPI0030ECF55B|tara:strand:- start:4028 stop:4414 length:387 start_codon:yes stop_codon:yes gene_type:complete